MRMKWRLFSVSLSVSIAMPPIPECSFSDVRVELKVSVEEKHHHKNINGHIRFVNMGFI